MRNFIKIKIASPNKILSWTERALPNGELIGEINKPDTIDYDKFRPIMGGLFCEKIFGPIKDLECYCKKYKKIQKKIGTKRTVNICPKCKVEITVSKIRNYRMGYINLSTSVINPLYIQTTPNYVAILTNKTTNEIQKIKNNKSYITNKNKIFITGPDAIKILLKNTNLKLITKKLNEKIENIKKEHKENLSEKRLIYYNKLRIINNFVQSKTKPSWMTIKFLPVLPPNLRPIVKLKDKAIITTDLNKLYSNIISSNNKIIKLRKMYVPEAFLTGEKAILQNKVDRLIGGEKQTLTNKSKNTKSLTENIKGKRGRFRENLLGKTVDYSGRSVIVVEPNLKLNECGLPKDIALELFQPIIIKKLLQAKLAQSIREAKIKTLKGDPLITNLIIKTIENSRNKKLFIN